MTNSTIDILKQKSASTLESLSLFIAWLTKSGADLFTQAVPYLDQSKGVVLWLAELIAFAGIALLIMKGVALVYGGMLADGLMTMVAAIALAVLCLLIGMIAAPDNSPKPKQNRR